MKETISFWERHPALFFGLSFYLGFLFVLETAWAILPFCFLLLHKIKVFPATLLFLIPACLIYQLYTFPQSGSSVEGIFHIDSLKKSERFGSGWIYSGMLKTADGRIACRTFSKTAYTPNSTYKVSGTVRPVRSCLYSLKTKGAWEPVKKRISLVLWRNEAQEYVRAYIEKHIVQKRAAVFLQGIVTGQLEDKVMMQEFNQLGLSHLMAISGLHFSLIALAFHLVLRLFLPPKPEALCLIIILTGYLLFIGDTPSVLRTWIAAMVFLGSQLVEKRSSALNSMGVALLISLMWNPLSSTTLSFQLSFLATAGILFFYAPLDQLLQNWLPKRALKEVCKKNPFWQHGYIIITFFRESLALTCAVHCAICLLLIQAFHYLSLNSLIYNLFFPFLASAALLFFLASIPLGHWGHVLNGHYCDWILRIPESPPLLFKTFYFPEVPSWLSSLLLTLLLITAVRMKVQKSADRLGVADYPLFNHL